jgi:hypothetical protein
MADKPNSSTRVEAVQRYATNHCQWPSDANLKRRNALSIGDDQSGMWLTPSWTLNPINGHVKGHPSFEISKDEKPILGPYSKDPRGPNRMGLDNKSILACF